MTEPMRTSSFSKITGALVQILKADPPVVDEIYRARGRAIPQTVTRAITVQFDGAVPQPAAINDAPIDWTSRFLIECFAKAGNGLECDEAVDPLVMAVYDRIAADTTLGGLVGIVHEPMIETEYSTDGERTGWVRMLFPVQHRTEQSTLE